MISSDDFGGTFQDFMKQMASQGPAEEPVFLRRLRDRFGVEPATLAVVTETFEAHDLPNSMVLDLNSGGRAT